MSQPTTHANRTPLLPPLDDNLQLAHLIADVTRKSRQEVLERLYLEETEFRYNVPRQFSEYGLPSGVWCDELLQFYRETDAFVYESAVWNRRPLKLKMRRLIGDYVARMMGPGLRVLCFGDGLGFESAYLARLGHDVTYHEVSEFNIRFAESLFDLNRVSVQVVRDESELQPQSFDLIVSMDVLEHVPDPTQVVSCFSNWLSDKGLVIVNAPFYLVSAQFPTHLRASRRWSGEYRKLYKKYGLRPVGCGFLWSPLILSKSLKTPPRSSLTAFRLWIGGSILRLGRRVQFPFLLAERLVSKGERRWPEELREILDSLDDGP